MLVMLVDRVGVVPEAYGFPFAAHNSLPFKSFGIDGSLSAEREYTSDDG
jgi:hypothetical protein